MDGGSAPGGSCLSVLFEVFFGVRRNACMIDPQIL